MGIISAKAKQVLMNTISVTSGFSLVKQKFNEELQRINKYRKAV